MPGRTRHVRAIVLGRTRLSEQDLIVTMLAETGEQVRAVAKGARRPGGRLAARVELFCEVDLLLAAGRGPLGVISEASLIDAHARLRGSPERVSAASAIAEVARLGCYEDVADPFLHPICSRALLACEQAGVGPGLDMMVAGYVLKLCAHGGWRPQLDACVACEDPAVSHLSVDAGGTLCASCSKDVAGAEPLAPGHASWAAALIGCTFDELLSAECDRATATWLLEFAHRWAATHLDARLRALEFLRAPAQSVGAGDVSWR